jgi:site-specific DNA-cytosine methylase
MMNEWEKISDELRNRLKVLNLFCGGGGVSAALQLLGIMPLLSIDFWKIAETVFCHNFKDSPFWLADIGAIQPNDILRRLLLMAGELDMMIITSPCQGVSVAKGFIDVLDFRNGLFLHSIDLVATMQPKTVWFEWVPGLVDPRATALRNEVNYQFMEKLFPHYNCKCFKLRASNYATPQQRDRLIWFLYRKDLGVVPTAPMVNYDCLDKLRIVDIAPEITAIKTGQSKKVFKANNKIMTTITATDGGIIVYSGGQKTKLTIPQLLRFAGFPDWYQIPEGIKYEDAHEIIGNVVPVPFAQHIIMHILMEVGHKL